MFPCAGVAGESSSALEHACNVRRASTVATSLNSVYAQAARYPEFAAPYSEASFLNLTVSTVHTADAAYGTSSVTVTVNVTRAGFVYCAAVLRGASPANVLAIKASGVKASTSASVSTQAG